MEKLPPFVKLAQATPFISGLGQDNQKEIKILLVDDNRLFRRLIRKIIEKQNDFLVIGEAPDGKKTLKLVHEVNPDVIIMDVNMPDMDGIEATQKIKADMPNVRIIGLSFNSNPKVIRDMKNAGATAYLKKDEAFDTLCKTICKSTFKA